MLDNAGKEVVVNFLKQKLVVEGNVNFTVLGGDFGRNGLQDEGFGIFLGVANVVEA